MFLYISQRNPSERTSYIARIRRIKAQKNELKKYNKKRPSQILKGTKQTNNNTSRSHDTKKNYQATKQGEQRERETRIYNHSCTHHGKGNINTRVYI